jgi:hypothetical protein
MARGHAMTSASTAARVPRKQFPKLAEDKLDLDFFEKL